MVRTALPFLPHPDVGMGQRKLYAGTQRDLKIRSGALLPVLTPGNTNAMG